MLGWKEHSGHLGVGLSKIKKAQGAWLSPPWLSLCGNLSVRSPNSGQEIDARNCSFHSWMQPRLQVGMMKQVGLWKVLVAEERGGLRMPGWGSFLLAHSHSCVSASLPAPVPCPVFFPQDHIPVPYQPDSSSNPSSTTSSTPSSPAPPLPPSATPPSPLHPSPQCTRQKNFNLPGTFALGELRGPREGEVGFEPEPFPAGPRLKAMG